LVIQLKIANSKKASTQRQEREAVFAMWTIPQRDPKAKAWANLFLIIDPQSIMDFDQLMQIIYNVRSLLLHTYFITSFQL
jgi:hypothetical protein